MTEILAAAQWDAAYENGKYKDESPIPFVGRIIEELGPDGGKLFGLYPGCGNGRNFIPLLEAGLNIRGLDISQEGIQQIITKYPAAENMVRVDNFDALTAARVFDYIVAIQVFQHGDEQQVKKHFSIAADALKPAGKLFLRINSTSTEIDEQHTVKEANELGGFTVTYESGEKAGTDIHFFSHPELKQLADDFGFKPIGHYTEVIETRKPPKTGTWTQWESVWQKR